MNVVKNNPKFWEALTPGSFTSQRITADLSNKMARQVNVEEKLLGLADLREAEGDLNVAEVLRWLVSTQEHGCSLYLEFCAISTFYDVYAMVLVSEAPMQPWELYGDEEGVLTMACVRAENFSEVLGIDVPPGQRRPSHFDMACVEIMKKIKTLRPDEETSLWGPANET